jgi:hypothetical protein
MTKLIRKYNKILLVVLGSFLMVAFLFSGVPSFLQGSPGRTVEGTLAGKKVRAEQLGEAAREFGFLADMVPADVEQLNVEGVTHWFLLSHEAKAQGLVGTPLDGDAWLDEVASSQVPAFALQQAIRDFASQGSGLDERTIMNALRNNPQLQQQFAQSWLTKPENREQVDNLPSTLAANLRRNRDQLASRAGLSVDQANSALAAMRGVSRLVQSAELSNRFSDKRFQLTLQREQDAVLADVLTIPASALPIDAQPTPELLSQLFEQGKDKEPNRATGEFGYRQPNRVRLQWFVLSRAQLSAAIAIDGVQARTEYERNRAAYPGEYASERPRIEEALRGKILAEALATAEQTFRQRVRINTRTLTADGAIKKLTPEFVSQAPELGAYASAVVDALATNEKLTIAAPSVQSRTEWVRVDRLSTLPALGSASYSLAGRPLGFSQLIEQLHEFDAKSALGLQVGIPFDGALRTPEGDLAFFIVSEAKLASPAESQDEVREDLVRDARLVMAFEQLQAKAQEWKALATTSSLDDVAAKFSAGSLTGSTPTSSASVVRQQRFALGESTLMSGVGREPLRDAVIAAAEARGRLTPATQGERASRVVVTSLPAARAIAFAEIVGAAPTTLEDFRRIPSFGADNLARFERSSLRTVANASPTGEAQAPAAPASPFSFEALKQRLAWQPVTNESR